MHELLHTQTLVITSVRVRPHSCREVSCKAVNKNMDFPLQCFGWACEVWCMFYEHNRLSYVCTKVLLLPVYAETHGPIQEFGPTRSSLGDSVGSLSPFVASYGPKTGLKTGTFQHLNQLICSRRNPGENKKNILWNKKMWDQTHVPPKHVQDNKM